MTAVSLMAMVEKLASLKTINEKNISQVLGVELFSTKTQSNEYYHLYESKPSRLWPSVDLRLPLAKGGTFLAITPPPSVIKRRELEEKWGVPKIEHQPVAPHPEQKSPHVSKIGYRRGGKTILWYFDPEEIVNLVTINTGR